MSILKELEEMKGKLENLERERSKVQGKREGLMEQLKTMGIDSYEDGVARLAQLKAERDQAEQEAERLLEKFKEDYKEFI